MSSEAAAAPSQALETAKPAQNDELQAPPKALSDEEIEEAMQCPCIDGMKSGSCGEPFVAAYRCFLRSTAEPKGVDCHELFLAMHSCIQQHPDEYDMSKDDDEDFDARGSSRESSGAYEIYEDGRQVPVPNSGPIEDVGRQAPVSGSSPIRDVGGEGGSSTADESSIHATPPQPSDGIATP